MLTRHSVQEREREREVSELVLRMRERNKDAMREFDAFTLHVCLSFSRRVLVLTLVNDQHRRSKTRLELSWGFSSFTYSLVVLLSCNLCLWVKEYAHLLTCHHQFKTFSNRLVLFISLSSEVSDTISWYILYFCWSSSVQMIIFLFSRGHDIKDSLLWSSLWIKPGNTNSCSRKSKLLYVDQTGSQELSLRRRGLSKMWCNCDYKECKTSSHTSPSTRNPSRETLESEDRILVPTHSLVSRV